MRVPRSPVSTRAVIIVTLVLAAAFVLVRLALGTSLAGFTVASDDFVDPALTPDRLPVTTESGGYDGQFVYRLALDPWTSVVTDHGIRLDNAPYRHQRIATPALAWLVGLLPGVSTLLALLLVNLGALAVAAGYAARLARALGRHPLWGLVLAVPAGMPISLGRHLTEPVAWAAVLAGLWYARERRWGPAAVALTVAVLGRETSLVVVAGLAVAALWRLLAPAAPVRPPVPRVSPEAVTPPVPAQRTRVPQPDRAGHPDRAGLPDRAGAPGRAGLPNGAGLPDRAGAPGRPGPPTRVAGAARPGLPAEPAGDAARRDGWPLVWLAVPVLVAIAWQLVLAEVWGVLPVRSGGPTNFGGVPVLGVLGSLAADVPGGTAVTLVVTAERVAVLALFAYAGWALATRRSRPAVGEVIAWGLAVAMTLALTGWSTDVQFLRAGNEAIGLTILVALADRTRTGRWALLLAGAMAVGVALEYTVRQ